MTKPQTAIDNNINLTYLDYKFTDLYENTYKEIYVSSMLFAKQRKCRICVSKDHRSLNGIGRRNISSYIWN